MAEATLRVRGYREFMRACARADRETGRAVRATFAASGEVVRSDAAVMFAPIDARSAAGYRTRVTTRGVFVNQSIRKRTGKRPDYGSLQMRRALLPALLSNARQVEADFERAIDRVCDHFEAGP